MIIDVSRLENVGDVLELDYEYEPAEEELGDDVALLKPVEVKFVLTRGREQIWLSGEINAELQLHCDRCLKGFAEHLHGTYSEEYVPQYRRDEFDEDDDDGGVPTVFYSSSQIDVTEGLRQNLLLLLPTKRLCREECKGLCPSCGQDLNEGQCDCEVDNVDPRLEVLKTLKFNDEGSVN